MSDNLIAVIIGVVQGLTEFLPVSSTGHMILVGSLLGYEGESATVFEVFIQLGSMLAVFILYREKFIRMLNPSNVFGPGLTIRHILAGIVPVMAVGYLMHELIKTYLFSTGTVIIGLFLGALLLLVAEKFGKRFSGKEQVNDVENISIKQAFYVGLFQILSLWPGFSRSGSTISGGMFFGLTRKAAAEFSFIIAVPVMLIACTYDMIKNFDKLTGNDLTMISIGFVVAFVIAYISIVWFMRFLNKSTLASFAYYRIILSAIAYYYFFIK
ncbi:undecaprenyl-diphosphate phosphatase [Selenomonadales bacterium OttesenSCG-928-I06]|nr:undecaprenyl-diphosphate phosphatase [Selenomonadales bacterium OttesenSCG-928-I06]